MGSSTGRRWPLPIAAVALVVTGCGAKPAADQPAASPTPTPTPTVTPTPTAAPTLPRTPTPSPTASSTAASSYDAFARSWYAHTSFLTVSRTGAVHEFIGDGCCDPIIDLRYQLSNPRQRGAAWVADATVTAVIPHDYPGGQPPAVGRTYHVRVRNGFFHSFALAGMRFCDEKVQPGQCGA